MIEFELKYELEKIPEKIKELQMVNSKKQSDVYYDTKNFLLIKKGNFLRIRDNKKMDFKIDMDDNMHVYCQETSFNISEINQKNVEINKVLSVIGLNSIYRYNIIEDFLVYNELIELARIEKVRFIYNFEDDCTICIDKVENLGLFLEAEIMIDKDAISKEEAEIVKFSLIKRLKKAHIIDENSNTFNTGYVELYLLAHNSKAYEMGKFKL